MEYSLTMNEARIIIYLSQVDRFNYDDDRTRLSSTISNKLGIDMGNLSRYLTKLRHKRYVWRKEETGEWFISSDIKLSLRQFAKDVLWNCRQTTLDKIDSSLNEYIPTNKQTGDTNG